MEIVLRKRPLKKKVRLFNFGNSSQTSATVVNFCNGSQTLETGTEKPFPKGFQIFSKNQLFVRVIIFYFDSIFHDFFSK